MKITSRIIAILLSVILVTSFNVNVFADSDNSEPIRSTVYYPTSGSTSGGFTSLYGPYAYYNLPSGTLYVSYSWDGGGSGGATLIFERKTGLFYSYVTDCSWAETNAVTSVYLPSSGTYRVRIQSSNTGTYKSYAYNLFVY